MRKKRGLSILLLIALLLTLLPSGVLAEGEKQEAVVFLDGTSGNDANDGASAEQAVQTLGKAYDRLLAMDGGAVAVSPDAVGTIVVCGDTEAVGNGNFNIDPISYRHAGRVVITGSREGAENCAKLILGSASAARYLQLGGPTTFTGLTLENVGADKKKALTIYTADAVTMDETVTTVGGEYIYLCGGAKQQTDVSGGVSITVLGGEFGFVSANNRSGSHADVLGDSVIHIGGSAKIESLLAGAYKQSTREGISSVIVTMTGGMVSGYYAGGDTGTVRRSTLVLHDGEIGTYYAGRDGGRVDSAVLDVRGGSIAKCCYVGGRGGNAAVTDSSILLSGGTVAKLADVEAGKTTVTNLTVTLTGETALPLMETLNNVEQVDLAISAAEDLEMAPPGAPWDSLSLVDNSTVALTSICPAGLELLVGHGSVLTFAQGDTATWSGCGTAIRAGQHESGTHAWSEWATVLQPTDVAPGREERTCTLCGEPESREIPALGELEEDCLVIYAGDHGDDENDGRTYSTAVKTLDGAYQRLLALEAGAVRLDSAAEGTIVVCGDVTVKDVDFNASLANEHAGTVKLTSFYRMDYRTAYGAKLYLGERMVQDVPKELYFQLGGPTVFDDITLYRLKSSQFVTFYVGSSLLMGEGVSVENTTYTSASANPIAIRGGYYSMDSEEPVSITLLGGDYNFACTSNSAHGLATGGGSITVGGTARVNRIVAGQIKTASTAVVEYVAITVEGGGRVNAIYAGGDGGGLSWCEVTIRGGTAPKLHATRKTGGIGVPTRLTLVLEGAGVLPGDLNLDYVEEAELSLVGGERTIALSEAWDALTMTGSSRAALNGAYPQNIALTILDGSVLTLREGERMTAQWTGCGAVWDNEGEHKGAHTYGSWTTVGVGDGTITRRHVCTFCGHWEEETTPACVHNWEKGRCTLCGADQYVVYVGGTAVRVPGDGRTAITPVATLEEALSLILNTPVTSDPNLTGYVVICGAAPAGSFTAASHAGRLVVTSVYAENTASGETDYRRNGAAAAGDGGTVAWGGPVELRDVTLAGNLTLVGGAMTMGENVETTGNVTLVGTDGADISVSSGRYDGALPGGGTLTIAGSGAVKALSAGGDALRLILRDAAVLPETLDITAADTVLELWGPDCVLGAELSPFRTIRVMDGASVTLTALFPAGARLEVAETAAVLLTWPNTAVPGSGTRLEHVSVGDVAVDYGTAILDVDFESISGGTVADATGNHNGTIHGAPEVAAGYDGGTALRFDNPHGGAADSYVDFGRVPLGDGDFSILLWVKTDGGGTNGFAADRASRINTNVLTDFLKFDNDPTSGGGENIGNRGGVILSNKDFSTVGKTGFALSSMPWYTYFTTNLYAGSGKEVQLAGMKSVQDGRWHQVAVTYDRDGFQRVYVDDRLATSADISALAGLALDVADESEHLILGADGLGNYGAGGVTVDDLQIFSGALEETAVQTRYYAKETLALAGELDGRGVVPGSQYSAAAIREIGAKRDVAVESARAILSGQNGMSLYGGQAVYTAFKAAYEEFLLGNEPNLKLLAVGDTHLSYSNDARGSAFVQALEEAKALGVSAVVHAGDFTNQGYGNEYTAFFDCMDGLVGAYGMNLYLTMGNHEYHNESAASEGRFLAGLKDLGVLPEEYDKTYYEGELGGYRFLVLNQYQYDPTQVGYAYITDIGVEQLTWLTERLEAYGGKGKPVFLVIHQGAPSAGTAGELHCYPAALQELLKAYPNVVLFSGHIHDNLGDRGGVIPVNGADGEALLYTVNLPSFRNNNTGYGMAMNWPEGVQHSGYYVYVYDDVIQLRARDFATGEWLTAYDEAIPVNAPAAEPAGPVASTTKKDRNSGQEALSFTDVPQGAWYEEAVRFVTERSLFQGTEKDRFSPTLTLSRAMLAAVLYRAAGEPQVEEEGQAAFTDVDWENWYGRAVAWAWQTGVTTGTSAQTFSPEAAITREQMALMLYRRAGSPEVTAELSGYTDGGAVSSWALRAMRWAVEQGIISGRTGGCLAPGAQVTRAEAAVMLMRYLEPLEKKQTL